MENIPKELIMKITEYTIRENRYNTYNECMKSGKDFFNIFLVFGLYNSELNRYKNLIKFIKKLKNTMYYD